LTPPHLFHYFIINFDIFAVEIITASSSILKRYGLCSSNYDVSLMHAVYYEFNTQNAHKILQMLLFNNFYK